jgi:hypothetical protein
MPIIGTALYTFSIMLPLYHLFKQVVLGLNPDVTRETTSNIYQLHFRSVVTARNYIKHLPTPFSFGCYGELLTTVNIGWTYTRIRWQLDDRFSIIYSIANLSLAKLEVSRVRGANSETFPHATHAVFPSHFALSHLTVSHFALKMISLLEFPWTQACFYITYITLAC